MLLVTKEVFALVTLTAESKIVDNVKGTITFPENNEGPFRVELNLSTEQMKLFLDVCASSEDSTLIRMEAFGSNEKFLSDKLFVKKYDISPSIHGEYKVLILAYEVKRIISLPNPDANHGNITFWLNFSADIPGNDLVEKRYDGNVRVKAASEDYTTLIISDDLTFKFKRFYTYQNNENGYSVRRYKVCEVITKNEIVNQEIIDDIIRKLEDFLLLVSFGYGNRVTWTGYEYTDKNNH